MSDSQEAFANALLEKGYTLARGNRRGFVAVDHTGEVYSLPRWTGEKPKDLRTRLGDEGQLPSVEKPQHQISEMASSRLGQLRDKLLTKRQATRGEHNAKLTNATADHIDKLAEAKRDQKLALSGLAKEHGSRFRTGLFGLLDRLNGRRKRIAEQNRLERERLQRQQKQERINLRLGLDRERSSVDAQMANIEARSEKMLSDIAADIETLRNLSLAHKPKHVVRRRRKREKPARE